MAEHRVGQVEDVRGSGIYPGTGPFPPGNAPVRSPAALAHPEERRRSRVSRAGLENAALLAGRALFGGFFVYNGINHFLSRDMLVGYARSKGVSSADMAVPATGVMLLAGGLSILAGVQPKVGAALIATFLAGVSPRMHAFWKEQEPQGRTNEMVNFTKNVALIGGSLIAAAHAEPWIHQLRIRRSPGLARVNS